MATLLSRATGNFTASATWALCDTTSELDSEANSTASTTSFVQSSTFTPGVITIDALAIKLSARVASPTGTFTIELYNITLASSVTNTSTTVNVSDINVNGNGWYVFPTTGNITLVGATGYAIRIKSSVSAEVTLYRDATAGNWTRQLRTTTQQAPVSGDKLLICGEHTGAGTGNDITITMNETATTSYGPTVSGGPPQGISVNKRGTLTYGASASTNYYLKYKGVLAVYGSGTLNMGTSGTPIPSTSSAVLEMDSAANVDTGLDIKPGGVFNAYGNPKWPTSAITGATNATPIEITSTSHGLVAGDRITVASVGGNTVANGTWEVIASTGANTFTIGSINGATGGGPGNTTGNGAYTSGGTWQRLPYTMLASDEAAAQTVIGPLLSTAGWANSDELCFASTTQTASQCEKKTITTVDSATQVTLTAGLTNAHSGTSPTRCEVGNLTRNVKIRGISTSLQGYVVFQTTSTVVCQNVEFLQLGSATASKRGIDITTTTGSCSITYCSIHDFIVTSSFGISLSGAAVNNVTCSSNVIYNTANSHVSIAVATSGTTLTFDGNLLVLNAGVNGFNLGDVGGTVTNNVVVGTTTTGVAFNEAAVIGTFSGNTIHSCVSIAINLNVAGVSGTITNSLIWRNGGRGISSATNVNAVTIDTATLFGNTTSSIGPSAAGGWLFKNIVSAGDTTFTTASGIEISTSVLMAGFVFENCTFGVVSGIRTAHTQDISCAATYAQITLQNCLLASSTEVLSQSSLLSGSYIRSQKHDQTTGSHKSWFRNGTISTDTTIKYAGFQSLRLTPNNASSKLESSQPFRIPLASSLTCNVQVRVRKSTSGDGATYNGNQPRLILKKNVAAGISSDTVLSTATSVANGAFETLFGTSSAITDDGVLEFVVDCDGTTGWVNIAVWSSDANADSTKLKYWLEGGPFCVPWTDLVVSNIKGLRTGGRL